MSSFKLRCFSVATTLFLLAGSLRADEVRTWQTCFSATVSNNLDLSIARLKLKEAEAALKSQHTYAIRGWRGYPSPSRDAAAAEWGSYPAKPAHHGHPAW